MRTPQIRGLTYVPNFLLPEECKDILSCIDRRSWSNVLQRRVQHYGYVYDYRKREIDKTMKLGPLPQFLKDLARLLKRQEYFKWLPDQAIINEYMPGQGIAAHIDCTPCFKDTIATISLGWCYEMKFINTYTRERKWLDLEVGSLLVLQDDARYKWTHEIQRKMDDLGIMRQRRVSITFRNVILK
jgi:alkylated DNA repair dioxygenase AlkB